MTGTVLPRNTIRGEKQSRTGGREAGRWVVCGSTWGSMTAEVDRHRRSWVQTSRLIVPGAVQQARLRPARRMVACFG